jgi:hypothetical protein
MDTRLGLGRGHIDLSEIDCFLLLELIEKGRNICVHMPVFIGMIDRFSQNMK